MKIELPVDRAALQARVAELYRLPLRSLTFVPEGECSLGYRVDCADGERYFLKLWADSRLGAKTRARMATFLGVTRELYERGVIERLSAPVRMRDGALHAGYDSYALALFLFMQGQPLPVDGRPLPPGVRDEVARVMARLHRATGELRCPLPAEDAFDMGFAADLRRGLDLLGAPSPAWRAGQLRLRELLLPRREALLADLAKVAALREAARAEAPALVLCHTDMGGNNVLVGPDGAISILDWDDLVLAPVEHDLHEYRGAGYAQFLAAYRQAGGAVPRGTLQFRFYLLRRYLADLTDWLLRIFEENTADGQDAADLAGIEGYCLPALDHFEGEIDAIAQALQQS